MRRYSMPIDSLTIAGTLALAACSTPAPPPSQATVDARVARATAIAGNDLKFLLPVCNPQPAERPAGPGVEDGIRKQIARPAPEPGQVFENLYFVGSAWVSAWVLKTSEGLILIDALNNADEAGALIEGGMRKLGLDPAQIRYLIVTHGHGDHYGGAVSLVEKYRMRVVATELDWSMMETKLEFDTPIWDARHDATSPSRMATGSRSAIPPSLRTSRPGTRWGRYRPYSTCAPGGATTRCCSGVARRSTLVATSDGLTTMQPRPSGCAASRGIFRPTCCCRTIRAGTTRSRRWRLSGPIATVRIRSSLARRWSIGRCRSWANALGAARPVPDALSVPGRVG